MTGRARLLRLPAVLGMAAVLAAGCAGTDPDDGGSAAGGSTAPSAAAAAAPAEHAGHEDPERAAGRALAVDVSGGRVTGDTGRVPVELGERVTLTVTVDAADELHLHGYDLTAELVPGEPAVVTFPADIPGVFEAELHDAGTVLLSLQVG
ncbi:hypothetical protein [Trujillonella endophytica]|uniref:Cupredoxin-like domain-containing protein n=1 Tax=Trujillonella endophytica TaxID=673521 RepID=A0A1H8UUQ4_9ACTN|nr:hypothetical protein [Trujillella endophytica]SEP06919.1 hypothetical protein SAMN05660991_03114 [Trujillella endophytica]